MGQQPRRNGSTRRGRANAKAVLRGSTICWICGHDGADAADHVTALARGGSNTLVNLKPAHSVDPCPTCGERCNLRKGAREWAPIIRRSGSLKA